MSTGGPAQRPASGPATSPRVGGENVRDPRCKLWATGANGSRGGGGWVDPRALHRPHRLPEAKAHDLKAVIIAGVTPPRATAPHPLRRRLRALAIGMMAVLIGLYCARPATQIGVVLSAPGGGAPSHHARGNALAPRGAVGAAGARLRPPHLERRLPHRCGHVQRERPRPGRDTDPRAGDVPGHHDLADRTRVFAWYNVLLDGGYAVAGSRGAADAAGSRAWRRSRR